MKYSNQYWW